MLKRNANIVKRKIHDTYFLIDITQNYLEDTCSLYEINEIGAFIWDQINESNTINDIAMNLYQVIQDDSIEWNDIINDVKEYIDLLKNEKFVVENNGRAE